MNAQNGDSDNRDPPFDATVQGQRAFFGRRKGHKLRAHQADLVAHLLPRLALDITGPHCTDLTRSFDQPVDRVRLEIGFGGGEHLIAEAGEVGNIRLFAGDASELLAWVPAKSLARIDLIHPDPWPKRRHWKRRFVQDATIAAMARALAQDGEFRFVSDISDYSAWTLAHFMHTSDFVWTAERASDWREPWPAYTMTRYGRKAEREGRNATYLVFRKTG
jgi:tRNA (guanine-N7-)-methyltransferase